MEVIDKDHVIGGSRSGSLGKLGAMTTMTRYRHRWAALAVLLTAEAMNLLDSTIVQVAGPVIHAGLPGPEAEIPWFSAAYTLPFAVFLITGGRLGDFHGRARVFRIGVAGFVLASLACACAGSAGFLIGARVVQGAAAAIIIPQTIGLIRALFDGDELPKALGSIGPVMGLSAICGPLLGGVLTHADLFGLSWRSVFLVNVPLGLAVLCATPLLREDRAEPRSRSLLGMVLVEKSLFTNRGFPAALAGSLLFFAVMTGLMQVVPMQLQLGLGLDVQSAGLTLFPLSAGLAVSSWIAGSRLVPRYGARLMYAGLALLLAGIFVAVAVYAGGVRSYPWPLLGALALCGLGMGTFTVPFFTAALHRVRPAETGSAAGLLNAVQQLGGTLGVALLSSVFLSSGKVNAALGTGAGLVLLAAFAVSPMISSRRDR